MGNVEGLFRQQARAWAMRSKDRAPKVSFLVGVLTSLLAGCAAGPDFKPPSPPAVGAYTAAPLPQATASASVPLGEAQRLHIGSSPAQAWWRMLGSPKLDALIDEALSANPSLTAARANLRQAQELYFARAGSTEYPQISADLGAQRQRVNPSSLGQTGAAHEFSLYNAGIGVHYQFDLAGGNQRALEALAARVDYQRYQLEGERLLLAGNIATAAIARARLAAQIEATEAIIGAQAQQLRIARDRLHFGQADPGEVLALQSQLEGTRAQLPVLIQKLQQTEHSIAVLAGRAPAAGHIPAFTLADFQLPTDLPVVIPSELVRHRPDIQAAEALLHTANAEYGVAVAKLYPQIDLGASLGSQALTTGALFGGGSAVWSVVGQLTQPLFNPGLPAEKRASLAALDAAAANYQGVVLDALRNVADVLRALDHDAQILAALASSDTAAQASLGSMERQYALGSVSYIQLLISRQQAQQSRIGLIAAQAQRLADSVALCQALGDGYERSDADKMSAPTVSMGQASAERIHPIDAAWLTSGSNEASPF